MGRPSASLGRPHFLNPVCAATDSCRASTSALLAAATSPLVEASSAPLVEATAAQPPLVEACRRLVEPAALGCRRLGGLPAAVLPLVGRHGVAPAPHPRPHLGRRPAGRSLGRRRRAAHDPLLPLLHP